MCPIEAFRGGLGVCRTGMNLGVLTFEPKAYITHYRKEKTKCIILYRAPFKCADNLSRCFCTFITKLLPVQEITNALPFHRISLDGLEENDAIDQDLQGYILHRIHSSPEIQNNISLNGKMDNTTFGKLSAHLKALSQGSFLYLKLTFDLIEKGYLVLKSSSYKVRRRLSVSSP